MRFLSDSRSVIPNVSGFALVVSSPSADQFDESLMLYAVGAAASGISHPFIEGPELIRGYSNQPHIGILQYKVGKVTRRWE